MKNDNKRNIGKMRQGKKYEKVEKDGEQKNNEKDEK